MSDKTQVGQSATAEIGKHVFVFLMLCSAFFPLYMMFTISTKTNTQFFNDEFMAPYVGREGFWAETADNYTQAWLTVHSSIPNSIFLAVCSVVAILFCATLAAFVFARFQFPGKRLLWSLLLVLMLMPGVANLIPLFILLRTLGLLNTYTALILCFTSAGQVFNIYVLRNYIEETPEALFEAAEVDGCGLLGQIWNIVVPMNGSILATLACLATVQVWNNFLLPLIVIRDPGRLPLPVVLFNLEQAYVKDWGVTMAAYAIAAVPLTIFFLFTMRYFIRGVGAGAVKG